MSNWKLLEERRVTKDNHWLHQSVDRKYVSDSSFGFNGVFRVIIDRSMVRCLASDGMGWQHVSVTVEGDSRPPRWSVMCAVKDLFWEDEDWVVQFHPARSQYVNYHPGCLHLWRPLNEQLPTPLAMMVGPRS